MTEEIIRDAYCRIRTIDNTIPDDVLDFMLKASLEKLSNLKYKELLDEECSRIYKMVEPKFI